METHNLLSSMQQKKSSKKGKSSKKMKPVRVVYISNPMKVKTSAADFRALVQELTGQDAEFPDPSKFPAAADSDNDVDVDVDVGVGVGVGVGHQVVISDDSPKMMMMRDDDEDDSVLEVAAATTIDSCSNEQPESSGSTALYDPTCTFNDAFMPNMFDNISGLFPAADLFYHSPQYCP